MNSNVLKNFDLKNKTIILTGSAGLLGKQFSRILSEFGANIILVDINEQENLKLEKSLKLKFNTNPLSIKVDLTKESEVKNLVKTILKKYKKIDILINNVAFHPTTKEKNISKPLTSFPLDLWEKALELNLTGLFFLCKEIGKVMEKQKSGNIINISSIYGLVGPDQRIYGKSKLNSPISYAASKGAVLNITRYLAAYWSKKNIRVNTLTLGGVLDDKYMSKDFIKNYSEKTMLNRMAKKNEYNLALLFLASNASSYMTGSNLIIDGGWTAW